MRNRVAIGMAIASFLAATDALADEFMAVTPSGATEALFSGNVDATSAAVSNMCIDLKWTVISTTPTVVTCEAPVSMGRSLMGTLLMGNSYSTPPREFYRFNIAEYQGHSRVQASGWMELQMAFGQMKRTDFSGPTFHNGAMNLLQRYGGQYPEGTTFNNHASMGVEFAKNAGAVIGSVVPGSAASEAGMQPGDQIVRLAGEKIKVPNDLFDGLAKAAKVPSFPVEVLRGSQKLVLTMPTRIRPPAGAPLWPEVSTAVTSAVSIAPPPASIADELAKFAKLRDDGVISPAEFESQKQRLLAK